MIVREREALLLFPPSAQGEAGRGDDGSYGEHVVKEDEIVHGWSFNRS